DGELGAGMLATGAGVALASHAVKAGSRALLNTSPEPVSNWTASATEDGVVDGALGPMWTVAWPVLGVVVTLGVGLLLLLWWAWRRLFRRAPRRAAPWAPGRVRIAAPPAGGASRGTGCRGGARAWAIMPGPGGVERFAWLRR